MSHTKGGEPAPLRSSFPPQALLTSAIILYYFPTPRASHHVPYLAISKVMILYETLLTSARYTFYQPGRLQQLVTMLAYQSMSQSLSTSSSVSNFDSALLVKGGLAARQLRTVSLRVCYWNKTEQCLIASF